MSPRAAFTNRGWAGYPVALVAVALTTGVLGIAQELAHAHLANVSILYLVAVLVTASAFGRGPAVLASVAASLSFNWFFVEPYHTLVVARPEEWLTLMLFLLAAVITGQLAAAQRRQAQDAVLREREAQLLYDVMRLMAEGGMDEALQSVAERLRSELGLAAVAIEVGEDGGVRVRVGDAEPATDARAGRVLLDGRPPTAGGRASPSRWVRLVGSGKVPGRDEGLHVVPVRAQERRVGAIYLTPAQGQAARFTPVERRLLSAVSAQLGALVERIALQQRATEAEVLRRTDELRSALLEAVSHDLRTPLASIRTSAGSLLQHDVAWTEQDRREFAESIDQEAQRLDRIVGNLLDLSRIEAGSLRPEKDWHDFAGLVDDVVGRLAPLFADHAISVIVPDDLPPLHLDVVEMDQVLTNLLENAASHTPPGREVLVTTRLDRDRLLVQVEDNGPGIPAELLRRLFQPFVRATQVPGHKGAGLGLAIARGLVEAHGGRMWAENRPGGGAGFYFTMPVTAPTVVPEKVHP